MKTFRRGFTLIEVALFLVVTGALFAAVTIGVQNSIYQQRQTDAVQNLAEFIRSAYAQTTNVQSEGSGRTDSAIYGKLLTFGEKYNLAGEAIPDNKSMVFSYNVIGTIGETDSNNILESLSALGANVVTLDGSDYRPVGLAESYTPRWTSVIQSDNAYSVFKGAVLIVRHPKSGTVYTYVMKGKTVEVNEAVKNANQSVEVVESVNPLLSLIRDGSFIIQQVDLCLNTNDNPSTGLRHDIRIVKNARNSSGVETIMNDDGSCAVED